MNENNQETMTSSDHLFMEEYEKWQDSLKSKDGYLRKALNELKFAYIIGMAYPSVFDANEFIGNFIHYLFAGIIKMDLDYVDAVQKAYKSLSNLVTVEETDLDLLQLVFYLGINDFHNMNYRKVNAEGHEPKLSFACVKKVTEQFRKHENPHDELVESVPYIARSPCFELENFPQCKEYCEWFSKVIKTVSKKELLTLMRFVLINDLFSDSDIFT